jgi:hypothetical protein
LWFLSWFVSYDVRSKSAAVDGQAQKKAYADRDGERHKWALLNFLGHSTQRVVAKLHRLTSVFCSVIAYGKSTKSVGQAA